MLDNTAHSVLGFSNCVHETGMYVFTTAASCLAIYTLSNNKHFFNWFLVGLFIFAATLSKGLPGLFPLAIPFLYYCCFRQTTFAKMLLQSFAVLLVVGVTYFIIIKTNTTAADSLHIYFFDRLLARVSAQPIVSSRWQTVVYLFSDLIILFVPFIFIILFKIKLNLSLVQKKYFLFFLLIGFSAAAPLMLTKVQRSFYNIPCFPFFAIAFAILYQHAVVQFSVWLQLNKVRFKVGKAIAIFTLLAGIIFCTAAIGTAKRDKDMLHDVNIIAKHLPAFTNVCCDNVFAQEWSLRTYLIRYNNIELNDKDSTLPYCITLKQADSLLPNYVKIPLGLINYDLWRKQNFAK
jgi:4-amino-4-deoxy-L-arabinose transferase-like glycosyltransferase